MGWKRIVQWTAASVVACVLIGVAGVKGLDTFRYHRERSLKNARIKAREAALRQVLTAMQQYADANEGHYFPPRSGKPGEFLPDFEEWAKLAPDKAAFEQARKTLTDPNERRLCYTGYIFFGDYEGTFLDILERDPQRFRGMESSEVKDDPASADVPAFYPLGNGVEWRYVRIFEFHGMPPTSDRLKYFVPVLWEMPKGEGDCVSVLHMDGFVMTERYPHAGFESRFFINRLKTLMGLPQDPGFDSSASIVPIVRSAEKVLGSCLYFDAHPSVSVQDCRGYRLSFICNELVLFPNCEPAAALDAKNLFPAPDAAAGSEQRVPVFVGSGCGYHWYARADYASLCKLRRTLALTGGQNLYQAAAAYWKNCAGWDAWWQVHDLQARKNTLSTSMKSFAQHGLMSKNEVRDSIVDAGAILEGLHWEGYGTLERPSKDVVEQAMQNLLAASKNDPSLAAAAAVFYAIPYRCRGPRVKITDEGVEFLKRFPRDAAVSAIKSLLTNIDEQKEAELCGELLKRIQQ